MLFACFHLVGGDDPEFVVPVYLIPLCQTHITGASCTVGEEKQPKAYHDPACIAIDRFHEFGDLFRIRDGGVFPACWFLEYHTSVDVRTRVSLCLPVRYGKLENLAYLGKEPLARLQSTSGLHGLDDRDDLLGFYLVDRVLTYDGYGISSKKTLYSQYFSLRSSL